MLIFLTKFMYSMGILLCLVSKKANLQLLKKTVFSHLKCKYKFGPISILQKVFDHNMKQLELKTNHFTWQKYVNWWKVPAFVKWSDRLFWPRILTMHWNSITSTCQQSIYYFYLKITQTAQLPNSAKCVT